MKRLLTPLVQRAQEPISWEVMERSCKKISVDLSVEGNEVGGWGNNGER
jgi:hypothetical protein